MESKEIRVKIPAELSELESISNINWQLAVNKILKEKFDEIKKIREIIDKSKLTEKQAEKLSDEVNLDLAKRYEELSKKTNRKLYKSH